MLDKEETVERKKIGIGAMTIATILTIVFVFFGIILVMRMIGKNNLATVVAGTEDTEAAGPEIGEKSHQLDENQILYEGKPYTLNTDLITILVMGIDKLDTVVQEAEDETDGGQADALFLVALNPHKKTINIIGINRNTMADIDIYDEQGNCVDTVRAQIAVQHGFGDGREKSIRRKQSADCFTGCPFTGMPL